jgi:hypothetical protein
MSESHRSADQNVVPESPYQMEKAIDIEAENRTATGSFPTDIFSDQPVPSSAVLCSTFDVRRSAIGRCKP